MTPEIIAIETPVTDYLYNQASADQALRDRFFQYLKPERPPRKGENILVSAEEWEQKLLSFAQKVNMRIIPASPAEQAIQVRNRIFGEPIAVEAGGALANSFDTLVKASVKGVPLADGVFVTAVGEGLSGKVFVDSLPGKLIHPPAQGRQMEAHVFPIDNDRIIVALPSFINPPSNFMSARQLDEIEIGPDTRMIALGGYMKYTGKYNEFLDAVLQRAESISPDLRQRPTIVLTAAAQDIAASEDLQNAIEKARKIAPVMVLANTGEFRRLMNMDTDWRKPHESKWVVNGKELEGNDLEKAKWADKEYIAAKQDANAVAYQAAYERFGQGALPVTFVVTNGGRGVHVVDGNRVSETYIPPRPPHGVVNTVGAGDGFAAGYMLGSLRGLPQKACVDLGFVCAGEIIGQDKARLNPKTITQDLDGVPFVLSGLPAPAYLDPQNPIHYGLLHQLVQEPRLLTLSTGTGKQKQPAAGHTP